MAYLDSNKIYRFLLSKNDLFTLAFDYDPRFSVVSEIQFLIEKLFCLDPCQKKLIDVKENFTEIFQEDGKEALSLYLVVLGQSFSLPKENSFSILSFSQLIAKVPRTKLRLIFLKVLQFLSDDKSHLIEAYEIKNKGTSSEVCLRQF